MQRLDKHVDTEGKPVAEESFNEISKMLYRIKDFEQVYHISENIFKPKEEAFQFKKTLEEVVAITGNDLAKKNIELTLSCGDSTPQFIRGDPVKFKQILLNLILQSISGIYRGFVRVKADVTQFERKPFLSIDIENSKFVLHKKDQLRIHKLT